MSRYGCIINDLRRSRAHLLFAAVGRVLYRSRITTHDSTASVRRAYTSGRIAPNTEADPGDIDRDEQTFPIPDGSGCLEGMSHFDIAVIGGGPAGTSAAITAAQRRHRVLLLERGSFPRQKVCGEFVSSEALQLLKLLLADLEILATPLEITRARIFVDGKTRDTKIEPAACSIPRFILDQALWKSAEKAGVTALENRTVQEISGTGRFASSPIQTNISLERSSTPVAAGQIWLSTCVCPN